MWMGAKKPGCVGLPRFKKSDILTENVSTLLMADQVEGRAKNETFDLEFFVDLRNSGAYWGCCADSSDIYKSL